MDVGKNSDGAAHWLWLAVFAVVIAFLGGSSRHDAIQQVALRPITALFLIPSLYYLTTARLKEVKTLALLLALLTLWTFLQLIPLPPALWQMLPDRDLLVSLDTAISAEATWRPISFAPSRGWNSLAALSVPIVAFFLALAVRPSPRSLLMIVVGLGVLDALLGFLQISGGARNPLYFYEITNRGSLVGIFANENHSAVFSALALVTLARLASDSRQARDPTWLRVSYAPSFLLLMLAILVSGSRAGVVTGIIAIAGSLVIAWQALYRKKRRKSRSRIASAIEKRPALLLVGNGVAIALLVFTFFGLERAPGFDDIVAKNTFEDLRWQLWPILETMVGQHWSIGIGFGAFEAFYHIYEPAALLRPDYVNQAHNDWAQFVIEGGLPSIAILGAFLFWLTLQIKVFLPEISSLGGLLTYWLAALAILGSASLVDYPLRAPIFSAVLVWLVLALAFETRQPKEVS